MPKNTRGSWPANCAPCGVDFSFAPVVDLARGNAAIGVRAFHADPKVAGELSQAYVRGMHLGGMAAGAEAFSRTWFG